MLIGICGIPMENDVFGACDACLLVVTVWGLRGCVVHRVNTDTSFCLDISLFPKLHPEKYLKS